MGAECHRKDNSIICMAFTAIGSKDDELSLDGASPLIALSLLRLTSAPRNIIRFGMKGPRSARGRAEIADLMLSTNLMQKVIISTTSFSHRSHCNKDF